MLSKSQFVSLRSGGYVDTGGRRSFLRCHGDGDPLIVVHGGPGLDHSYLVDWLLPLADRHALVFYDQLACGRDETPIGDVTADGFARQLQSIAQGINGPSPLSFLSHSWGSHVLLEYLAKYATVKPKSAILSNPMALTSKRFAQSGERLVSRMSPEAMATMERYEGDSSPEAGAAVMAAALPYYVGSPLAVPDVRFPFYSSAVFNKVIESLGEFDLTDQIRNLPRSLVIYCENDFESADGSPELATAPGVTAVHIPRAGHLPFAETPREFLSLVSGFLAG